ncbi:hypothetical protein [Lactiplantibacillus herbarum]|nr:hypothetical protein [Lactiplantibacillus herbarum]
MGIYIFWKAGLPTTSSASHTSSVSNDPFGGLHSFILNLITSAKN